MRSLYLVMLSALALGALGAEIVELSKAEVYVPDGVGCNKLQYPVFSLKANNTVIGIPKGVNEWSHYTINAEVDTVISGWIMLIGVDPVSISITNECHLSMMIVAVLIVVGVFILGLLICTFVCLCRCANCCKKKKDYGSLYEDDDDSTTPLPRPFRTR